MTERPVDRGFVLHTRPYRETSVIVYLLTHAHGVIHAVARGARSARGVGVPLQPFRLLGLSWTGRGSLATLTGREVDHIFSLTGAHLNAGLYLNELLMRLLRESDRNELLYEAYLVAVAALADKRAMEPTLRLFEKVLLEELGYAIDFTCDCTSGEPVNGSDRYRFDPELGFARAADGAGTPGHHLLAIAAGDFSDPGVLRSAKQLFRIALRPHLGERPLASRSLFRHG